MSLQKPEDPSFENPNTEGDSVDTTGIQLAVEGLLDPRSAEYQSAVKLTPATMAHYRTQGKWVPATHLMYISSILATEISQGDARIIIEVPPRHGKSELTSVHTPIWFIEHFPWAFVLLTTYAADLATGFGRRVRDAFLQDNGQFLKAKVRDDVQRTDHFLTTEGGGMGSVGIGGPITGRGAHLLLIDDYIKNWAEASSDLVLQAIWDWFTTTAYTRLEPGGSCVILATRWVLDDLIGRLKAQDKSHVWQVIRLPAIAEQANDDPENFVAPDALGRQAGEALWSYRYPIEKLTQIQSIIGDFMFSAMYQQDPKRAGDVKADVSQIRIVDSIPNMEKYRWARSWDLAATGDEKNAKGKKKKSDFSVGTLMGAEGRPGSSTASTAIADVKRGKWKPKEVEDKLLATAEEDGKNVPILIEQEPGASGKSWANHLKTIVLRDYKVLILPPSGGNKFIRAQPYCASVSNGRIIYLRAAWNKVCKDELEKFPNDRHDDTVDSAAQGYNYLHQTKLLLPTWGRTGELTGMQQTEAGIVYGQRVADVGTKLIRGCTWGRPRTPNY